MLKTIIPIKGMHCKSCEILIGEKLEEIKNIKSAKLSFKTKEALVYHKGPLDMELLADAVREAGYEIGEEKPRAWVSTDLNDYADLGMAFLVLALLYFLGSGLGLFNINVTNGNPSSLLVVLLVGLTAGVSTCMAMIGGLVLGVSARHNEKHPEATAVQKFRPHLYFNLGRIISYFVFGGLVGMIGKVFQFSSPVLGALTIVVGIVMLILGLKLIDIFPRLSNASLTLPAGVSRFLGLKKHNEKEYSHLNSMVVGGMTFFLPCGFTQAMQLYAMSTGNFLAGALIMATFAIGTAPGLLSIGGLASVVRGGAAKMFFKFAGLVVILLSLFNISNGYNLTGWSLDFGTQSSTTGQETNVTIVNGVQIVKMTQTAYGYSPNKFVIKKGLPVRWVIDAKDTSSCSSGLSVPKLGITKNLILGENIVEFTPSEVGKIKFTCLMGMYPGEFTVVENDTTAESKVSSGLNPITANASDSITKPAAGSNSVSTAAPASSLQIIRTAYASSNEDISPSEFNVKVGQPVRFDIDVKKNGSGCMSTIMVPGLYNSAQYLEAGKVISMEFTPDKKGSFLITCAMGIPRGVINVI